VGNSVRGTSGGAWNGRRRRSPFSSSFRRIFPSGAAQFGSRSPGSSASHRWLICVTSSFLSIYFKMKVIIEDQHRILAI
jgi:hypothetical protein